MTDPKATMPLAEALAWVEGQTASLREYAERGGALSEVEQRHIAAFSTLCAAVRQYEAALGESWWLIASLRRHPGTDVQALDHIVAQMQDKWRGPAAWRKAALDAALANPVAFDPEG